MGDGAVSVEVPAKGEWELAVEVIPCIGDTLVGEAELSRETTAVPAGQAAQWRGQRHHG